MVDQVAGLRESVSRADAFRRLTDQHLDSSYRLARAIVGPAEAEDATHDALVAAWRSWSTLRDPALFEHWFHRILINTCRNRLRSGSRRRVRDISGELPNASTTDSIGQAIDRDLIGSALSLLRPDDRVVVALRFYRDLTIDEIAAQLGVRPGTVKSRLHNALRRLHAILDRELKVPNDG